jgi:hypothetical protein
MADKYTFHLLRSTLGLSMILYNPASGISTFDVIMGRQSSASPTRKRKEVSTHVYNLQPQEQKLHTYQSPVQVDRIWRNDLKMSVFVCI